MIGIIDYGASNIRSIANALHYLGGQVTLALDPEQIRDAEKIILPGVGAFGPSMAVLKERGFVDFLHEAAKQGKPILGICLGMQLLLDSSEEGGYHEGVGLIPGRCVRFTISGKVPHMGWNQLSFKQPHPLANGIPSNGCYAYFVHSYHPADVPSEYVISTTDYGYAYPSIIGRKNVVGAQFHPEKSQSVGLRLLKNFIEL